MIGVSFIVPVRNGGATIRRTIEAILAQADGRPMEIIVIDDGSDDDSRLILESLCHTSPLRVMPGEGRGAAAAINLGVRHAAFPLIGQVDQDVVLLPGWMPRLVEVLDDPSVAAAQGYYRTDPAGSLFARAMGLDLEQRYAAIEGSATDHVCTGNAIYRAAALHDVGLFDESLGYGYDNDMSYRLRCAGHRLVLCRAAESHHQWREGLTGYCVQQYGFGYGRLDVVAKHPGRVSGDSVSPALMMSHPVLTLLALFCCCGFAAPNGPFTTIAAGGVFVLLALALERLVAGVRAARRFKSATPLLFPALHLLRNLVWVGAIMIWAFRRLRGRPFLPGHSMRPRRSAESVQAHARAHSLAEASAVLCLIPVHNEAENIPTVVRELRAERPDLEILIIDDGSQDATSMVADRLDVRLIRLPERMGIGSAMRAGLRYAARAGFHAAVRVDGDGQHRPGDIRQLLLPILKDDADVVVGSRFTAAAARPVRTVRVLQRMLAACLSTLLRNRITDPTSGFSAFGPRAIELLAEEHPRGYPEPELLMLLNRSGLRVIEAPVSGRERLTGRTSLTPSRLAGAVGRVMLAMVVFPLRPAVKVVVRDSLDSTRLARRQRHAVDCGAGSRQTSQAHRGVFVPLDLSSLVLLGLAIKRDTLHTAARWLGVFYPPTLLLLLLILIVFVASLCFSVIVSRQRKQIERLIEETAILSAELRELRKAHTDGVSSPQRPRT